MMAEWLGYLLILVNHKIYLADMRQMFTGVLGYEYEWYLWDLEKDIRLLVALTDFVQLPGQQLHFC